jgi:hypothetical protein
MHYDDERDGMILLDRNVCGKVKVIFLSLRTEYRITFTTRGAIYFLFKIDRCLMISVDIVTMQNMVITDLPSSKMSLSALGEEPS